MFTGIIQEVGGLREKIPQGPALRFRFSAPKTAVGLNPGDSVACNGVCLTAEEVAAEGFIATAVPETLQRSALGDLRVGDPINLEPALKAGTPLGGHFVQGHVDGVAEVVALKELSGGGGRELRVRIPAGFERYCIEKGSFALHGVSLTIASLESGELRFALVPHTLAHTNLRTVGAGARLNFEVDLLGKYVEKLLNTRLGSPAGAVEGAAVQGTGSSRLDAASLEKWGYGI
jgi:riboflavin synthase